MPGRCCAQQLTITGECSVMPAIFNPSAAHTPPHFLILKIDASASISWLFILALYYMPSNSLIPPHTSDKKLPPCCKILYAAFLLRAARFMRTLRFANFLRNRTLAIWRPPFCTSCAQPFCTRFWRAKRRGHFFRKAARFFEFLHLLRKAISLPIEEDGFVFDFLFPFVFFLLETTHLYSIGAKCDGK